MEPNEQATALRLLLRWLHLSDAILDSGVRLSPTDGDTLEELRTLTANFVHTDPRKRVPVPSRRPPPVLELVDGLRVTGVRPTAAPCIHAPAPSRPVPLPGETYRCSRCGAWVGEMPEIEVIPVCRHCQAEGHDLPNCPLLPQVPVHPATR